VDDEVGKLTNEGRRWSSPAVLDWGKGRGMEDGERREDVERRMGTGRECSLRRVGLGAPHHEAHERVLRGESKVLESEGVFALMGCDEMGIPARPRR
jgi:hypothetical protein